MAKFDFKKILLEKGEKIVLVAAGVGMLGLIGLGVTNALTASDSKEFAGKITEKAKQIRSQIANPDSATVPDLPDWVKKPYVQTSLPDANESLTARHPMFDPIATPSSKRANPVVLGVTEFQADPVWAKVDSYDIYTNSTGTDTLIGVLKTIATGNEITIKNAYKLTDLNKRLTHVPLPGGQRPSGPGMPPGGPGMMPGGPGMAPGGPGMAPGGPGMAPGGPGMMPGGPGMGRGGEGGGFPGGEAASEFKRVGIEYVSVRNDKDLEGKTPVRTIYPQRMIVLNASFPYKLQLDRVREALRLSTVNEVYSSVENVPVFTGVNVQRRVLAVDGKTVLVDWSTLPYEEEFRKQLFKRSNRAEAENPDLNLVKLDPTNGLWMWLPGLMPGNTYPELKLPSLLATIKKFKDMQRVPAVPRALKQELGEGSIFAPPASAPEASGGAGMAPGADGMGMPKSTGSSGAAGGGGPGFNPADAGGIQNLQNGEAPDAVLVRILDTAIAPGYKYQYRIQVKMKNPNLGKKSEVSRPSDADIKELTGEWVEMKDMVTMPPESHVYAVDSSSDRNKTPKEGQALLQYHRWLSKITLGDDTGEPVGDWVVTDVLVNKGQFVGGKQMVTLPQWSSTENRFKIEGADSVATGPKGKENKGIQLDPTAGLLEAYLVVDIEGGRRKRSVAPIKTSDDRTNGVVKQFDEEVTTDILLLDTKTGKMTVFNSAADRDNKLRKETEERWKKWILEVETGMKSAPSTTTPGAAKGSGRFGEQ